MDSLSLLQGSFLTQESNWGLLHCRWILYHLSQQGSPKILEWIAYPFSRGFSRPRNQTGVSCIAGGFFTSSAIREAIFIYVLWLSPCPTLCTPMDCSPPGSSVHGDSPARILEWVAMPSSGGYSQPRGQTHCAWILDHLSHQGSPRILEWIAYPFSRGISDPGIKLGSHCRQILYQLSYQGSLLCS